MITIEIADEGGPGDLISATDYMFKLAADEFCEAIKKVRTGQLDDVQAAAALMKELKTAFHSAVSERARIDRLRGTVAGVGGGQELDLDAAREEVLRRLACLRDAGTGD